ncbi:hypothetical protein YA49_18730 [Enterobacter cloacae subsp. cloacae]|nr:hypothetical protein YA49_18730 [Enterobacter cloacae subsp. cloacae]
MFSPLEIQAAEVFNKENSRIEILGEMNANRQFSSDPDDNGDETYARFTFLGETQLHDNVTGYGIFQYNFQGNDIDGNSGSSAWLTYAGMKWDDRFSVDYGRNDGLLYDAAVWTDVLPVFGNDTYTEEDTFMTGRASNLITLRSQDMLGWMEGLDFAIQYQGQNTGARDPMRQNGHGWGYSLNYKNNSGLYFAAAYTRSERTDEQKRHTGYQVGNAEAWAASLKYDDSEYYFAMTWGETHHLTALNDSEVARKTKNLEVVMQYQFDSGFRPSIAWLQSVANTSAYRHFDRVKYLDLAMFYELDEHFTLYVDHKINLLNSGSDAVQAYEISTANITAAGLIYNF